MREGEDARAAARAAQSARDTARWREALALQWHAVECAQRAGDAALHAHALRHVADILSDSGDCDAALPVYRDVLAIYAGGGFDAIDIANAVRGAALNFERLGATDDARALWRDVRVRYAALDRYFAARLGGGNPGVAEAESHLAGLAAG